VVRPRESTIKKLNRYNFQINHVISPKEQDIDSVGKISQQPWQTAPQSQTMST